MSRSAARLKITAAALSVIVVIALTVSLVPRGSGLAQEAETDQLPQGPATPTALGPAIPPEFTQYADEWPGPQGNLAAHRAASNSPIDASTVNQLEVAWTFPIEATGAFGGMTGLPIIAGDTVYVQDMEGNVFAIDANSGELKWEKEYGIPTTGPNGVAIGYGLIFGTLGDTAETFALDAATGEEVWRIDLTNNQGEGIDMPPTVYDNTVYVSTVPGGSQSFYRGGTKGVLHALDAATGTILWTFDTTTDNLWGNPRINTGGGLWYPLSVDDEGNLYFGVGNAGPWPGTEEYPNGSSRPGPNDYASSMVSLDPATGAVRWYHNAKPHDLFDLDFQLTPVIATLPVDGEETKLAIGAGKTGTVIAANADTGEVLWETAVGRHENDELQEIPEGETVQVYPGSLGGVETPLAYADGTVFVPVLNLPTSFTATDVDISAGLDFASGTGELIALNAADGSVKWQVEFPSINVGAATVANDVVFTSALDGVFRAYHTETGEELWTYQASAGFNAPPAIAGDLIVVPAAGPLVAPPAPEAEATPAGPAGVEPATPPAAQPEIQFELIAFRLPGGETEAAAPTETASPEAGTGATETESAAGGEAAAEQLMIEAVDIDFIPAEVTAPADTAVTVTLVNNGALLHNFSIDPLGIDVDIAPGETVEVEINAAAGEYEYYCNVPGHRAAGQAGILILE